jgi:hypothetical protein
VERSEQAEVLLVRRDDLVVRAQTEPGNDELTAAGRGVGERDELRGCPENGGDSPADALSRLE